MPLTLLQNDLLVTLRAYLADELSLDDVRGWEVSVTDSSDIGPDEAEVIERLALIAETVFSGAMDEAVFAEEARRLVSLLEAESTSGAVAGTQAPDAQVQTALVEVGVVLTTTEQVTPLSQFVDISHVEVSV